MHLHACFNYGYGSRALLEGIAPNGSCDISGLKRLVNPLLVLHSSVSIAVIAPWARVAGGHSIQTPFLAVRNLTAHLGMLEYDSP
jgi:hypothetical protein